MVDIMLPMKLKILPRSRVSRDHWLRHTLSELQRLRNMKDDDIKILHNIAICHFYKSECTQPTQLLSELKVRCFCLDDTEYSSVHTAALVDE